MATTLEQFVTTAGQNVKKVLASNGVIMRFRDGTPINSKQYAGLARHRETTEERPETPRQPPVRPDVSGFDFEDQTKNTSRRFSRRNEWQFDEGDIAIQVYPVDTRAAQLRRLYTDHDGFDLYDWSIRYTLVREGGENEPSRQRTRIHPPRQPESLEQNFRRVVDRLRDLAAAYDGVIVHDTVMTAWNEKNL